MQETDSRERVLDANIRYHATLAKHYNLAQPQYRPENLKRVRRVLSELAVRAGSHRLCDLGCGTGFILDLAHDLFDMVTGVDITDAMMAHMTKRPNLSLVKTNTEVLPFADGTYNVITGYGFLHHLYDLELTLRQTYRCLKAGGIFYSDSDPNRDFWRSLRGLRKTDSPMIQREMDGIDTEIQRTLDTYGFKPDEGEIVELAEFQKMKRGGFDPNELTALFHKIGFEEVEVRPQWFLGQGQILRGESEQASRIVERYLLNALPLTKHLFKYLAIIARK